MVLILEGNSSTLEVWNQLLGVRDAQMCLNLINQAVKQRRIK